MLVIRDEQMAVLGQYMLGQYEKKVINFLQMNFADAKQKPVEQLKPFVREQIERARSYGLLTERQIAVYVTVAWLLGRTFDTYFLEASEGLTAFYRAADEKSKWLAEWARGKLILLYKKGEMSSLNVWKQML